MLSLPVFSQLDTIHWIPPMHARGEYGPQYLYISTPEPLPFPVEIRDGQGTVITTLTISNALPQRFSVGSSNDTRLLVQENDLHKPLTDRGLVLVGPKKFYTNFRAHSNSEYQASDLTCKGRAALGKVFRICHVIQGANGGGRSNFIGIMATEDNTVIQLSDFDSSVRFRIAGADELVVSPIIKTLNAGETMVMSQYINSSASFQPPNGLIGALLTSDKPIAVNVGSWTGAPTVENANDIGIDQIAPFELVGEEYILCKGNGGTILEIPIVVAHEDGTIVKINGSAIPAATLNAGQWLQITSNQYTSSGNIYIECSKPAFMYQMVGGVASGDDEKRTAGFIFVPPISCSIPNAVDNIYQPNKIGDVTYDGGLMVVAMKDSVITLKINGVTTPLGSPSPVTGNPDFVTYRNLTLFSSNNPPNTASIVSHGAVQVAMFGRNGAAGYGGFYSGFSKTDKPILSLGIIGDGVCPDTLVASGKFDGVQWYIADSLLQYGADSFYIAYSPGRYIARGYLGVCRKTDYVQDTVEAVFNSPVFPFTTKEPHCYGEESGQIAFGTPYGGIAPYEFSVNNGASFGPDSIVSQIAAGTYNLIVRDSTGCYNRPLAASVGQPDSLSVALATVNLKDPLKPGERVNLAAITNRNILFADWFPADTSGCSECLTYTAYPVETTWYSIIVTDSMGCTAEDRIQVILEPNVYAPNVFMPLSDKGNDRFLLFSKEQLPVNWLRIYDRWGSLVFEGINLLTNDYATGWDGSLKNKDLSPGVYIYMAEVAYFPGRLITLKGDVTLLR